jgi:hypothetical protein
MEVLVNLSNGISLKICHFWLKNLVFNYPGIFLQVIMEKVSDTNTEENLIAQSLWD